MENKKSELEIHFGLCVRNINFALAKTGKKDKLELTYHNDNSYELHKIEPNGSKKYIKLQCSARELADFLDGMEVVFRFE
jgi:hypothetical protein